VKCRDSQRVAIDEGLAKSRKYRSERRWRFVPTFEAKPCFNVSEVERVNGGYETNVVLAWNSEPYFYDWRRRYFVLAAA